MLLDTLICSFRSLGRKRLRSMLTIISIAIGVTSVVLIGAIGRIGREAIGRELNSLGLDGLAVSADSKFTSAVMTGEDLQLLRENPMVETATPVVVSYSNVRMRGLIANTVLWGVDGGSGDSLISLTTEYGRMLTDADLAGAAEVCVVDSSMARLFYKRDNIVGKKLQAMIGGSYVTLEIVGVASSGSGFLNAMVGDVIPSFAYVPYTTLQRYQGSDSFSQIAVTVKEGYSQDAAAGQLTQAINRLHSIDRGFKADNISKQKQTLDRVMDLITRVLSAVAAVSLVVAGLGVMTVMIVSVNERTREIGIKKSIGATRGIILREFLIEAFVISLTGSLVGLGAGLALAWLGCALLGLPMTVDFSLIAYSMLLSVGTGTVFGVYPAALAARMRPADALRSEG